MIGDHADGRCGNHDAARTGRKGVVGADCHHIAHPALAGPARVRAFDQAASQLRLTGEHHLLRTPGFRAER
jgi:hypothetical protein